MKSETVLPMALRMKEHWVQWMDFLMEWKKVQSWKEVLALYLVYQMVSSLALLKDMMMAPFDRIHNLIGMCRLIRQIPNIGSHYLRRNDMLSAMCLPFSSLSRIATENLHISKKFHIVRKSRDIRS